jgi:hypothetical protein
LVRKVRLLSIQRQILVKPNENTQGIPDAILAKHPELIRIGEALQSYMRGEPVVAHCLLCEEPLTVTYIEATATTWVTCPNNCTFYHDISEKDTGSD